MSDKLEMFDNPEYPSTAATTDPNVASSFNDLTATERATPPLTAPPDDVSAVRPLHGWKWFVACLSIYSTALLYGLDTTIAADVQPNIVKSLGSIGKLSWIGAGFPLGSVAIILPLGYAYGLFEIKKLYISSIIVFEVGSALCGAAPTMDVLIVGRVVAGAGGAGMYLGVLNYLGLFTTIRERSIYNSLIGLVWGTGTILGPVVGGGFAVSSATWRWAFYINLVIAAVFAPAFLFYLPTHQPDATTSLVNKLRRMDWVGIVLIAAVYTTYTIALIFGGTLWRWNDYRFITMIAFFGAILLTFVLTQYFCIFTTKERRVFPGHFLKSRTLVLVFIATSALNCSLFVGAYFIPLYFQFVHSDSAIMAAVRLLPFICVAITAIMLNGVFMPIFGYYMPWYLMSGVFLLIGGSLMYTINENTSPSNIYGYSALMAVGAGSALQAGYSIAAAKVKPHEVPAAIGFVNVAQIGCIVIGLTIAGSIFQNLAFSKLQAALAGYGYPADEIRNAIAGTQSAIFADGGEEVRKLALGAIIAAMDRVFILAIVAGAVTLVSALLMRRERLFMTVVAGG